jgi:hypothetical protein
LSTINLEIVFLDFPSAAWVRLMDSLRLNMLAGISGWKSRRAFLTSHVPGSASTVKVEPQKENPT